MFLRAPFDLNSTTRWLQATALLPVLCFNGYTWAIPVPDRLEIDESTLLQDYRIGGSGELISNGATTLQITTLAGAKLTLNNTTTTATGSNNAAIDLIDAVATINGSTVRAEGAGIRLGSTLNTGPGTTANVIASTIIGGTFGINVGSRGNLILQNTTVTGTDSGSRGIVVFDASVAATGSSITGQQNGLWMRAGPAGRLPPQVSLDSTHVEGIDGAAILIGAGANNPTTANLDISNGSTLKGGNGNVIELVGNSTGNINVSTSQLAGNIQIESGSTANLGFKQSSLSGDIIAESGGTANVALDNSQFTGRLINTSSVALNNGSQWVMVDNGSVTNLAMNGSSVKFGDPGAFYRLSVANLSGNGTFLMDVDFGKAQSDFLDITGTATGNHSLLIGSTGTDPLNDTSLHVVHAAAGDARFSLLGGPVDLGTWSYDLVKQGDNDWYLDTSTKTISPGTRTVLALFNTAPTVWYGELSTLRTRMGELRINGERSGGWMRTYGNKFNVADASGFGYKQVQQGISLGADGKLPMGDGQWLAGVMAGQSKSDLDLDRGTNGKVDSYYVGAYSTWLDSDTGYYFDGVLKFNRFQNKAKVNLSDGTRTKGDYNNSGVGASLEFGRHIKLDDGYYVEPYTQLSGVVIEGKDYQLDNGMRAEGDRSRSLLGKVGATVGRNFDLGKGRTVQPYVRAAVAHEFVNNNDVQVNDNVFHNDLSGTRGELGTGIAVALSDKFEVHADFEYSNGDKIEQPWGANVGIRYNW
ncbi:autotransporter outer membrane beta-barrel domain-containing protein [Pseudomonas sp. JUb42]|uniref:autotransporter outer membrane beta-barrel domain-containing protein n=1 Tax=Pseudomonas sp. JUb42 TaxID=2940611 RepID=UPI00286E396C|nr:autotransporter outer membrane beta-barrel domain-containing protein [Pseudomonas sp. JUb42]